MLSKNNTIDAMLAPNSTTTPHILKLLSNPRNKFIASTKRQTQQMHCNSKQWTFVQRKQKENGVNHLGWKKVRKLYTKAETICSHEGFIHKDYPHRCDDIEHPWCHIKCNFPITLCCRRHIQCITNFKIQWLYLHGKTCHQKQHRL